MSTSESCNSPIEEENDKTPLWKYVKRIGKVPGGGGTWRFECTFCKKEYSGSYHRVSGHLLKIANRGIAKCTKVTQHYDEMKKCVDQAELRLKLAMPRVVPLPPTSMGSSSTSITSTMAASDYDQRQQDTIYDSKKRRIGCMGGMNPIKKAFNLQERKNCHAEIARMVYSGGLPFNLAKNPYYQSSYTMVANSGLSGYVPPGYNLLRGPLLQKEKAHIHHLLEPIRSTWKSKGVTIVSDGWSDSQRRPLINFLAITSSGPMFLHAVNCEGEFKDKHYIAKLMDDTIKEVGPENVVQIITDNAAVCKAAGKIVEDKYPHIFWTPCVVHTLNLALKNICAASNTETNEMVYDECFWITIIRDDVVLIRNFINNHSMRLAMYKKHVPLKLLAVAETRFASVIVMLKRFKIIYEGLRSMVISSEWSTYKDDDVGRAQFVREKILDDEWWLKIDYILSFTGPIYEMLRKADTDKPCLHTMYDMWDSMIEEVKTKIYQHEKKGEHEESSFYNVVHNILISRWEKSNTPLHCLAHSLNPRYYSAEWLSGAPNRVPPHEDNEISIERNNCMKRFFQNPEARTLILGDFARFSMQEDAFADYDSIHDRGKLEPHAWWGIYGTSTPTLQKLAFRLLGQPCSSSCSERNWSTYSFIHSLKRNKLEPQRAQDLVYVNTNLRLLSRRNAHYTVGATKMWDVGGDEFDSMDDISTLELASLSLDEPELEGVVFLDNENENDDMASGGVPK